VAVALDVGEGLVPDHELLPALGRDAELTLGDLAVRPTDADLEHTQQDTVAGRLVDVLDPRRMRDARLDDERLHAAVRPPSTVRIVPVTNSAVAR